MERILSQSEQCHLTSRKSLHSSGPLSIRSAGSFNGSTPVPPTGSDDFKVLCSGECNYLWVHTVFIHLLHNRQIFLLYTVMVALVSVGVSAAAAIAYVGYKGNSHTHWGKLCGIYDGFYHSIKIQYAVRYIRRVVIHEYQAGDGIKMGNQKQSRNNKGDN